MPLSPDDFASDAARTIALQTARLGLIEPPVEQALQTLRRVRNGFAHSTTTATLTDPGHADRLFQAYAAARETSLWMPQERILQQQVGGPGEPPVEAGLRNYIPLEQPVAMAKARTWCPDPGR